MNIFTADFKVFVVGVRYFVFVTTILLMTRTTTALMSMAADAIIMVFNEFYAILHLHNR